MCVCVCVCVCVWWAGGQERGLDCVQESVSCVSVSVSVSAFVSMSVSLCVYVCVCVLFIIHHMHVLYDLYVVCVIKSFR